MVLYDVDIFWDKTGFLKLGIRQILIFWVLNIQINIIVKYSRTIPRILGKIANIFY